MGIRAFIDIALQMNSNKEIHIKIFCVNKVITFTKFPNNENSLL
jgi:hypothetical protein